MFEGLAIWEEGKYRDLQGTYPVISLSFAGVKEDNYETAKEKICNILTNVYAQYSFLRDSDVLIEADRLLFDRILTGKMKDTDATSALHQLSLYLYRYYEKKAIILLDEYDTPMQEAYVYGFWDKLVRFTRSLFNSTFKTNPYMSRAIMTGITRVSRESMFSDLNNLEVVTTTSSKYATSFGFTEEEVFNALDSIGKGDEKKRVKEWYDGFVLGLLVDLKDKYIITSNRESGFGRYDIMLEPVYPEKNDAIIIEFKVFNPRKELSIEETLEAAHAQIEEKKYEANLIAKGIKKDRIRKYGFVFEGKSVLIG